MDPELVRKTSKIFNLTTTNAVLMKLTVILYLRKIFIDFVVYWLPKQDTFFLTSLRSCQVYIDFSLLSNT